MSDDTRPCDVEDDGFVTVHPPFGADWLAQRRPIDPPSHKTHTEKFDAAIARVTDDRGKDYGPPGEDFARAQAIKAAVASCPHEGIRHAMEMIGVKMARLCVTPDHDDSIADIAGYARTMAMLLDEEKDG